MKKPNYYKEAFTETLNIIFLLVISITAVIFSKPLAAAFLALELFYMLYIPNNNSYQRYTNLKKGFQNEVGPAGTKSLLDPGIVLPYEIKTRCEKLEGKYHEILKRAERSADLKLMMADELQQMEYLVKNYLEFSVNLANYKEYLLNNNPETINQEMQNIKQRIATCFDALKNNDLDLAFKRMQKKNLLESNLEILQKRLAKIKQMKGLIETLTAQLDVIEDTFYLISDHIASFTPGDNLKIDFKRIVSGVENTEKVVKETRQEMDKLKNLNMNRLFE